MNYYERMEQKKNKVGEVSKKLEKVLKDFAKENELEDLTFGGITVSEEGFTTRLEGKFILEKEEEEVLFNQKAQYMGLKSGLFKKELEIDNKKFTIVDINTKAPVNSIIAESDDGRMYTLRSDSFKE